MKISGAHLLAKTDNTMEDDELEHILRAKRGCTRSIEHLLRSYESFIRSLIYPYYLEGADKNDLLQEIRIAFLDAIRRFKPGSNSFKNFVGLVVTRRAKTVISLYSGCKHRVLTRGVSLNKPVYGDQDIFLEELISVPGGYDDPETAYLKKEELEELMCFFKDSLSRLEYKVLLLYAEGHSYAHIADLLGISRKSVDNALDRVKKKARAFKESEEEDWTEYERNNCASFVPAGKKRGYASSLL